MHVIGEHVAEILDVIPAVYQVKVSAGRVTAAAAVRVQ